MVRLAAIGVNRADIQHPPIALLAKVRQRGLDEQERRPQVDGQCPVKRRESVFSRLPRAITAALFTRPSSRPKCAIDFGDDPRGNRGIVERADREGGLPTDFRRPSFFAASSPRPMNHDLAPSPANMRTMPSPMPVVEPVTKIDFVLQAHTCSQFCESLPAPRSRSSGDRPRASR